RDGIFVECLHLNVGGCHLVTHAKVLCCHHDRLRVLRLEDEKTRGHCKHRCNSEVDGSSHCITSLRVAFAYHTQIRGADDRQPYCSWEACHAEQPAANRRGELHFHTWPLDDPSCHKWI